MGIIFLTCTTDICVNSIFRTWKTLISTGAPHDGFLGRAQRDQYEKLQGLDAIVFEDILLLRFRVFLISVQN